MASAEDDAVEDMTRIATCSLMLKTPGLRNAQT
jgi:hypothetical protein